MKSKVVAVKKQSGGWNVKIRAESHFEILSFYVAGFLSFLDTLDKDADRAAAKEAMMRMVSEYGRDDNG